jgi:flagellar biosynthesis protein FlhB
MEKNNIKNSNPLKTVMVISMGMLLIYFVFKWQLAAIIAFSVGVVGLSSDFIAQKIEWAWLKLTYILSLIVPNILMSVVFYLILTPVALLSRIFGKSDVLNMKKPKNTMYREITKVFDVKSFENPW